ncbi:unnamed protein product [Strongylus vulgaris]|uniref:Uncharacterized protein n=1 Tax=Strongylus vulgaris TaxID=40348 RepID=A0A3P7JPV7_STRVU|nr:unnamed protein product [Strongylus vulgaris]
MLNYGSEMGALGQKIGKGPARSMNALTHGYPTFGLTGEPSNADKKLSQETLKSFGIPNLPGYPTFGLTGEPTNADKKLSQETLKSFGIPNLPGLNKIFNKLGGNRPSKRVRGYEPGYGAVNPNAPLAIGKVTFPKLHVWTTS